MRKSRIMWAIAMMAATGSALWSQTPRPIYQTVDTAVTPKIVMPAKPKPAPATLPVTYKTTQAIPEVRGHAPKTGRMDLIVPASATESGRGGVIQATATEKVVQPTVRQASRFVPAIRVDGGPIQPTAATEETLPTPIPVAPPVAAPRMEPIPANGSASGECNSCCKSCCKSCCGGKGNLHPLLAWFTYCPKGSCGHKCGPAPYIPRLYTFFLDHCPHGHQASPPHPVHH